MTRRKQKNKLRRLQANIFPKKIQNSPLHFVGKTSSTRSPPPVIIQGDSFVATSRSRLGCPERHFHGDQRLQCGRQQRWGKDMMSLSFMPNLHSGIPDNLKWIQFSYGFFHLAIWYGNSSYKNPSLFFLLEWTATWRKLQSLKFWNLNSPPKKKKTSPSSWQHQNFSAPHLQFTKISPDTLVSFLIDGWGNLPTFPSFDKNPLSIHTSALNRSRFVDIRMLTSGETPSGERESTCFHARGNRFWFWRGKRWVFHFCNTFSVKQKLS